MSPNSAAVDDRPVLHFERAARAPPALVFEMWTNPRHVAQWQRPKVFDQVEIEHMDVRPGGEFRMRMQTPAGLVYTSRIVYREVVAPERLVYRETCFEADALFHDADVAITFAAHAEGTRLDIRAALTLVPGRDPRWTLDAMRQGWTTGWKDNLDQFDTCLESQRSPGHASQPVPEADREIVITRLYDAPRELVFRAWSDPRHLGAWWGPNGFTTTTHEMDFRPGGRWRFIMHGPDGTDYPNLIVYREIVAPERLVYDHSDDVPDSPSDAFLATVTFAAVGKQTKVTLRIVFDTAEACQKTKEFGAVEGGQQTLARLAQYLPQMQ